MKKAVLLSCLSVLTLILAACQSPEVAANAQRFRSEGLQTYWGDGFSYLTVFLLESKSAL